MKFQEFAQHHKPILEKEIAAFLDTKRSDPIGTKLYPESIERLKALTSAGKMWRGLFVLLVEQLLKGNTYNSKSLKAAIAMELVQSALLIHDDIIDNDYTRRGGPTIFAQYIVENDVEYGKNMGICVGDTAIFMAYEALSQSTTDPETLTSLLRTFSRELHLVGIGEMLDVQMASSKTELATEEILNMYRFKTARYTFSLPFILGAQLAQADKNIMASLDIFGENAGILFQIRDDGLGLTGNEKETGKPVGADIKENKKTLHRALLYQQASKEEVITLNTCFGNKSLTEKERVFVLELVAKYAIQHKVTAVEQTYREQAFTALVNLPNALKEALEEVLLSVSTRKK